MSSGPLRKYLTTGSGNIYWDFENVVACRADTRCRDVVLRSRTPVTRRPSTARSGSICLTRAYSFATGGPLVQRTFHYNGVYGVYGATRTTRQRMGFPLMAQMNTSLVSTPNKLLSDNFKHIHSLSRPTILPTVCFKYRAPSAHESHWLFLPIQFLPIVGGCSINTTL